MDRPASDASLQKLTRRPHGPYPQTLHRASSTRPPSILHALTCAPYVVDASAPGFGGRRIRGERLSIASSCPSLLPNEKPVSDFSVTALSRKAWRRAMKSTARVIAIGSSNLMRASRTNPDRRWAVGMMGGIQRFRRRPCRRPRQSRPASTTAIASAGRRSRCLMLVMHACCS